MTIHAGTSGSSVWDQEPVWEWVHQDPSNTQRHDFTATREQEQRASSFTATASLAYQGKVLDRKEQAVFEALANPLWDFRTIDGVVEETHLSPSEVEAILNKHTNLFRKSLVPDVQGRSLYTLCSRPVTWRERLAVARMLLAKSFR